MNGMRALLGSLLLSMACGSKAGSEGPTAGATAGTNGGSVQELEANAGAGALPTEPAGGATGSDPEEAGGAGAASESSAGEGGGPAEPAVTFCDQHPHQFCADFDGALYAEGWDAQDVRGGGSVAPFANHSASAPRALLSRIERNENSAASATMNVTLPGGAEHYLLTMDLFIEEVPLSADAPFGELRLFQVVNGDSSTGLSLVFDHQGDRLWFATGNSESGYIWGGFIPRQEWLHLELSVTFSTLGTGTFALELGDAEPIHWMNSSLGGVPGSIELRLGLESSHGVYEASALYDNVTLDLLP